jgi:gamma-glutamyltranspeptidase
MRANPSPETRLRALNLSRAKHQQHQQHDEHQHRQRTHQRKDKETGMDFEGIYCFDTATVRFAVYPDGPEGARIVAQISENTLHDEFGAREVGDELLDACKKHFGVIAQAAIARYRADSRRPITLTHEDFGIRRSASPPAHQAGATADAVSA